MLHPFFNCRFLFSFPIFLKKGTEIRDGALRIEESVHEEGPGDLPPSKEQVSPLTLGFANG